MIMFQAFTHFTITTKDKSDTQAKTKSTLLQLSRKNKGNLLHFTERMSKTRSHLLFNS